MSSPTFVAKFADGVVTRMSCYCEPNQLDLQRGIKLSEAAYASRTKKAPPVIVEARFVEPFTDKVIKKYTVAELAPFSVRKVAASKAAATQAKKRAARAAKAEA